VEEEILEEEGVDNAEEEQTEPPTEEEEDDDDVSEIIQKLTPILGSAKEEGFTVNKLEIEREKEEE
jgi:hypothetical protein